MHAGELFDLWLGFVAMAILGAAAFLGLSVWSVVTATVRVLARRR